AATPTPVDAIEFYNQALDHYFITPIASEIAVLDAGTTIAGWTRTGYSFKVYPAQAAGTNAVCRFLIPPHHGASHFLSADVNECAQVLAYSTPGSASYNANFSDYVEETPAFFYIALPDRASGAYPAGTAPVYRLWDQRVDSNHRYTTNAQVRDAMLARGYAIEGYGPGPYPVAMCSPQ